MYDDRKIELYEEEKKKEYKEELNEKYYNIMGILLYKQEFLDTIRESNYKDYFDLIMRMNIMDTH